MSKAVAATSTQTSAFVPPARARTPAAPTAPADAASERSNTFLWRRDVRDAVTLYLRYAGNECWESTVGEDIRSAFRIIRSRLRRGWSIQSAVGEVERFAYNMADM